MGSLAENEHMSTKQHARKLSNWASVFEWPIGPSFWTYQRCWMKMWERSALLTTACVNEMVVIDSSNSLSFIWRPAITWTNADLFSIEPVKTNFSEISKCKLSFNKMRLKVSPAVCQPFCPYPNVFWWWWQRPIGFASVGTDWQIHTDIRKYRCIYFIKMFLLDIKLLK